MISDSEISCFFLILKTRDFEHFHLHHGKNYISKIFVINYEKTIFNFFIR